MSEENIPSENSKKEILNSKQEEVTKNISQQETIEQTETQPGTQNTKPETENMEVHHHPHVEKKNFKEYFLEFLMIFLAVTMGFFAENIREDISDSVHANDYVHSMISDLKNDVSIYKTNDSINNVYCNMIDTIFTLLKSNSNRGEIYYLARKLTMLGSMGSYINSKTYLQMTSTGAFRLIKHQSVADSIAVYYQFIKLFDDWSELHRARVNNLIFLNDKLFNADVFFSIYKAIDANTDSLQKILQSNPAFMTNDIREINTVMMQYQYYYGFLKLMNNRTSVALKQAESLIALLEKEYHIKD
jgi:hypothetical protein